MSRRGAQSIGGAVAVEHGHGLHVPCLREHVDRHDAAGAVAVVAQEAQVARERLRFAGDVGDAVGLEARERRESLGPRARARRVEHGERRCRQIAPEARYTMSPEQWQRAAEILADLEPEGGVDALIAGMGTGGTITGCGRRLKEANPACLVYGVEPRLGVHVQGLHSLADGFIPPVLDETVLDGKFIVGNRHAFSHARRAMLAEGLFGGISSGAVLHAGMRLAGRIEQGNIVLVFADGGWKYLGTDLWRDDAGEHEHDKAEDPLDDILWW